MKKPIFNTLSNEDKSALDQLVNTCNVEAEKSKPCGEGIPIPDNFKKEVIEHMKQGIKEIQNTMASTQLVKIIKTESLVRFFDGVHMQRTCSPRGDVFEFLRTKQDIFLPKGRLQTEESDGPADEVIFVLDDRSDLLNMPLTVVMAYKVWPYDDMSLRLSLKEITTNLNNEKL